MKTLKEQRQSSFLRLLLRPFRRDRPVRRNREEEEDNDLDDIKLITLSMRKKAPNLTINISNAITDPMSPLALCCYRCYTSVPCFLFQCLRCLPKTLAVRWCPSRVVRLSSLGLWDIIYNSWTVHVYLRHRKCDNRIHCQARQFRR